MIQEYLTKQQRLNKLHSSYLLNVDDLELAKADLERFIIDFLSVKNVTNNVFNIHNNPSTKSTKQIAAEVGFSENMNRLLTKSASDSKMLGDLGAQDRSVFNIHEDPSTKSTKQVAAEVGFSDDYIVIQKLESKTKNISVDQIRDMQKFLYKTSVISGKKIALIFGADQMNLNAANSCLKILEDTPKNTYIFLLTNNASNLLATIRSRCAKINHLYHKDKATPLNQEFVQALLIGSSPSDHQQFIEQFAAKDRDLWHEFTNNVTLLLAKLCKYQAGGLVENLTEYELALLKQMKYKSPQYLQNKYNKIIELIDKINIYDLDLRASCIMIFKEMRH